MIVCLCKGITEKQIQNAMQKFNNNTTKVLNFLKVGQDCGTCLSTAIKEISLKKPNTEQSSQKKSK